MEEERKKERKNQIFLIQFSYITSLNPTLRVKYSFQLVEPIPLQNKSNIV